VDWHQLCFQWQPKLLREENQELPITMNDQLLTILKKAKFNFAVLASILVLAIVGKLTNPEFTNSIFLMADQLVSELILLFVAITLGAFIPNFKLVVLGAIAAFIAAALAIQASVFTYLTIDYLFAVLLVVLGFASIANLYRHYREFSL
jgi:hypothetical protein